MQADVEVIADAAWAAGFIDGEGSISVRRIWHAKINRYVYQLYLRAAQVERSPLDKLVSVFGGTIHSHKPRRSRSAPFYDWALTGLRAAMAIRVMLPYLTLKRERALVGLEFQAIMRRGGRPKKEVRFMETEYPVQVAFWERMRILNLRYVERQAAAETEPSGSQAMQPEGCDSPICTDEKGAEGGRNDRLLKLAEKGSRSA